MEKGPDSKPGAAHINRLFPTCFVERWPWFPSESVKGGYKFGPSLFTRSEWEIHLFRPDTSFNSEWAGCTLSLPLRESLSRGHSEHPAHVQSV